VRPPLPAHDATGAAAFARQIAADLGRPLSVVHVVPGDDYSLEGHDDAPSVLADEQPVLASLYDASAADRQLLG
jgi:nucleotide-binding universal stress UspA family protein